MFTTVQNQPIEIDLLVQSNSTGWSVVNGEATHEACNQGSITLEGKPILAGETWSFSYKIKSISGGYVQPFMGETAGTQRTVAGDYVETLVVAGTTNPKFRFFAPATTACTISIFNIQKVLVVTALKQSNTTAFSEENNKWNPHYTYIPDCGFSLFTKMVTFKGGQPWIHKNTIEPRNNFYGVQYQSILQPVFNAGEGEPKTFHSISYEGSKLMITTTDGVQTSLGQISELIESDFLKDVLDDGVSEVKIYSKEGIYSSGFLRDKNEDLLNGGVLKGTYIIVELQTVSNEVLKLKNIRLHSEASKIGSR